MNKKLKVDFKGSIINGILIKEDDYFLTLKISSGYNIVLKKDEIKVIESLIVEKKEEEKEEDKKVQKNNDKDKILLIHTGGTIASKVDYKTGGVSSKFRPEELLDLYPEIKQKVEIDVLMLGNLFSEDLRFYHYNLLIKTIYERLVNENYKGVIISHGTDTMHYTSAALHYAFSNLKIPIILVGAQRSSDRPSSDAFSNLNTAVDFILYNNEYNLGFRRIGICMHSDLDDFSFNILDGINAFKGHSTRRDAFKQINYSPFAKILYNKNYTSFNIEILREDLLKSNIEGKFKYKLYDENLKIGFLKAHPNMFSEEINFYENFDALILEGTGLGHFPINEIDENTKEHLRICNSLKKLSKNTKLIMATQTKKGVVNLNVYSTGRKLKEIGIKGNYLNLISEVLFIRTAFILSNYKDEFDKIWNENLEGFEIRSIDLD